MSTTSGGEKPIQAHELLLRMAGRVPDASLAQARRMLADGAPRSAGALLGGVLTAARIPLTAAELAAVRSMTGDPGAIADAELADELPALPFVFSELDGTGAVDVDQLDEAVVAAVEPHGEAVRRIWRSWRYLDLDVLIAATPGSEQDEAAGPQEIIAGQDDLDEQGFGPLTQLTQAIETVTEPFGAYRVYLVQIADPALVQQVAASVLRVVPESANAGVEIIAAGAGLPPYQQVALAEGLPLWARVDRQFTMAQVFDFADPVSGPGFGPGHPLIDDPDERDQLLSYLNGGSLVLISMAMMDDILDPDAGAVVPTSFRTDGEWIWQDPVAYYLRQHCIAPNAELTAHIRQQLSEGVAVPDTDLQTTIRAACFMLQPPTGESSTAAWFPDQR